ncbi:MAG: biotin--[acetyl-CoA-carboxylase] ligase [Corynebacterium sp.]|nr:biotin--[acetyl-CoA-carboxylase] ligase [Corynebacterium sp.]
MTLSENEADLQADTPCVNVEALRRDLVELGPYRRFIHKTTTSSTNADLLAAVDTDIAPIPDWTVEVADYQSAGRGRLGRTWTAARGTQATVSVLLSLSDKEIERGLVEHAPLLPMLVSLAVVDVLHATFPEQAEQAKVKWPNDVFFDGKKLSGILCEARTVHGRPHFVVGVGLNTTMTADELPVPTATSIALIAEQLGVELEADIHEIIVRRLILALYRRIAEWRNYTDDQDELLAAYRAASQTLGSEVRLILPTTGSLEGEVITGTCVDFDSAGHIIIENSEGRHSYAAGDVEHLR